MNDYKKAINRLICGNTAHSCKADYIKLAIEALKKQDPQEPIEKNVQITKKYVFNDYVCPNCKTVMTSFETEAFRGKNLGIQYCWKCGQAIDWRKYE